MKSITAIELKEMIDSHQDIQIIDTRPDYDYQVCHIPGAINIPRSVILDKLDEIANNKPVYFYCKFGIKTNTIISTIKKHSNLTNLYPISDGIFSWARDVNQKFLDLI